MSIFTPALDMGSHINTHAQRRGQNHPKLLTEPLTRNAPLAPRPLQGVVRCRFCCSGLRWQQLGAMHDG
jgi:hypothetical protein